jgi:hypothetical protein
MHVQKIDRSLFFCSNALNATCEAPERLDASGLRRLQYVRYLVWQNLSEEDTRKEDLRPLIVHIFSVIASFISVAIRLTLCCRYPD